MAQIVESSLALLAPAPFLELLEALDSEIEFLDRRMPGADVTAQVKSFRRDLNKAVERARRVELWVTIAELSVLTHKPASTLRRICDERGEAIGARKVKGTWTIHWPTFESQTLLTKRPFEEAAA